MFIKSLVSPLALAATATLALSTASFAQTTVGDQQISDEDLPAVTEHCIMLADEGAAAGDVGADEARAAEAEADGAADVDAGAAADAGAADDAAGMDAGEDAAAGAEAGTTLDLEAITLDDCQAAGLVE